MTGNFCVLLFDQFVLRGLSAFTWSLTPKMKFTKIILFLIICVSLVITLRLNRKRPSTAWGVQKKLFQQKQDKEYYKSRDGTYKFEYDTGNGQYQSFRREKRLSDGTVIGFYGYIDPEGILRITEYIAGRNGYKQRSVLRYPI